MAQKIDRRLLRKMILQEMRSFMAEGKASYDDAVGGPSRVGEGLSSTSMRSSVTRLLKKGDSVKSAKLKTLLYVKDNGSVTAEIQNPDALDGAVAASKVEALFAREAKKHVNDEDFKKGSTYKVTIGLGPLSA